MKSCKVCQLSCILWDQKIKNSIKSIEFLVFNETNHLNFSDQKSKKGKNCNNYNIFYRIYIYCLLGMKKLHECGFWWTIRPLGLNTNYQEKIQ
jgi:hypothetical protein